ncbi:MAG: hypothetical protein AB7O98_01125 [Hyphomonadaceae bacterium]
MVVGLAGFFSLAANIATAEDAAGPSASFVAVDGVSFADPGDAFGNRFDFSFGAGADRRFTNLDTARANRGEDNDSRRYELAVTARAAAGFDVSFAQRGGVGFNREGDIERESRASELRLGRGLNARRREQSMEPTWYVFAASEDEALTWQPGGQRNAFGGTGGSLALQDRVEIGDVQAGITYEANGWQASLAYVQREVSVHTGSRTFSEDEDFTGFTLTMRH